MQQGILIYSLNRDVQLYNELKGWRNTWKHNRGASGELMLPLLAVMEEQISIQSSAHRLCQFIFQTFYHRTC